ncbi:MAG: hypothetical protein RIE52_14745 [Balneola sp.]|jgi:hypothetical protein
MMKFSRYIGIRTFGGISALMIIFMMSGCSFFAKPLELSSEHFLFTATTQTSSMEEMQEGINKAEKLYSALTKIIPSDYQLDSVIVVQLNGNYRTQGPYVDGDGTIQLWRYSDAEDGYWSLFTHELVHAIAFDTSVKLGALEWGSLGFYNEAWAEYVAPKISEVFSGAVTSERYPWKSLTSINN